MEKRKIEYILVVRNQKVDHDLFASRESWEESYPAQDFVSDEYALEYFRAIIKQFNDSLRKGEKPREMVRAFKRETVITETDL